jgi:hypothetical protein
MNSQAPRGRLVDARPLRTTSTDTAWDHAIARRDAIAAAVRRTLARDGLLALVIVSSNGNYPPWVRVEAWRPVTEYKGTSAERERSELTFVVDVTPYHEHTQVVSATLKRGRKTLTAGARPDFPDAAIAEWVHYALGRSEKPSNYTPFLDALQALAHFLTRFIPEPHRNRVDRRLRTPLRRNPVAILGLASLAFIAIGAAIIPIDEIRFYITYWITYGIPALLEGDTGALLYADGMPVLLFLLGIIGAVTAGVIVMRRRTAISVIDQPVVPPRSLGLVDSWHAVVSQVGSDPDAVRRRLIASIAEAANEGISSQMEVYGYRTPNGFEHRERLVVTKGQGQVHVHMHPFGNDMFVGWEAFLNWAQWLETVAVAQKIARGRQIEYRQLVSGGYVPNQFDLMDLNSLTELVHRRIEREVKALLKEREIDQQIDFKIIRGDRARALDEGQHQHQQQQQSGYV